MIRTYHVAIDLPWARRRSTQELRALLSHETGEPLSGWDVRRRLRDARAQGYAVLPCCAEVNAAGYCLGHEEGSHGHA
jgi:hypothetical protein